MRNISDNIDSSAIRDIIETIKMTFDGKVRVMINNRLRKKLYHYTREEIISKVDIPIDSLIDELDYE